VTTKPSPLVSPRREDVTVDNRTVDVIDSARAMEEQKEILPVVSDYVENTPNQAAAF
jgi:hypothetical protein